MTDWLHPGHPDYPYEEVMTDTPGTPLTPEQITAEHRLCGPKYEGCYSHWPMAHCRADGMAWPCDVALLATLDRERRERVDPDLRERLAALEHDQWIEWSRTVAEQGLTPERLARWAGYWVPYADLDEPTKDHDRKWADKVLAILAATPDHTVGGAER